MCVIGSFVLDHWGWELLVLGVEVVEGAPVTISERIQAWMGFRLTPAPVRFVWLAAGERRGVA